MGANIKDRVCIPDDCIVLDGAHIEEGFRVIGYEHYKESEVDFDILETDSKGKRNFVVQLSSDERKRAAQLNGL